MKNLKDKVVVITGAGSGIGRALAVEAAKAGAVLALSDWNEQSVRETEGLAAARNDASRGKVDVRSDDEVRAFADEVADELGGASVIVNNAGVAMSDFIGTMKRIDFEWLMDINFWGVVRGTEAFLPQLRAKDEAHVVNISSVFGLVGVPSQSAYNASKFAVRGYTEALRQELHDTRVNVTRVPSRRRADQHRSEAGKNWHTNVHGEPRRTRSDGARLRAARSDHARRGGARDLGGHPRQLAARARRR